MLLGCSGDGDTGTQMISIIMKATTGAVLKTFNQAGGSDEVYYNKGNNTYFLSMSSWTSSGKTGTGNPAPSLGIIDAGSADTGNGEPEFIQNILTTRTSHSVAAGLVSGVISTTTAAAAATMTAIKAMTLSVSTPMSLSTTVPIPLSGTATINETGGIGIYGRLP